MTKMVLLDRTNTYANSEWHLIETQTEDDSETYCGILFEQAGIDPDYIEDWNGVGWHGCCECKRLYDKVNQ